MNHTDQISLLEKKAWFQYLPQRQKKLLGVSLSLKTMHRDDSPRLDDYGFMVFPASKAYEGFLKRYFYDLGLLSEKVYTSKRFRIGRALNPDIRYEQRDEHWLYDDVMRECGKDVAQQLWNTWLECRNRIFHYFPRSDQKRLLTYNEAEAALSTLLDTIEVAAACNPKLIEEVVAKRENLPKT